MDYLPDNWRFKDDKNPAPGKTPKLKISRADQQWIGETLFVGKNKIKDLNRRCILSIFFYRIVTGAAFDIFLNS